MKDPTFHLRPLEHKDAPVFRALRLMSLQESATAFGSTVEEEACRPLEELAARIEPSGVAGDSCFLGAFAEDGQLVGMIGLARRPGVKRRHVMDLRSVYVLPECRGKGIGRMLLEAVLAYARGIEGVRHITLSVNATNTPARHLYQSLGFVCYGLEPAALCWNGVWHDEEYYIWRVSEKLDFLSHPPTPTA